MKKKLALLMAAIMSLTVLAGCSGKKDTNDNGLLQKDVIVMSTESGFAPFEYMNDKNEIVGVDVDIANKIAKKLNVKLEIKDMGFTEAISAAQTGKSDMVCAGMSVTEERKKAMDFSDVYLESSNLIIKKKDDKTINGPEDLKGKIVAVQTGTTGDDFAQKQEGIKEVKQYAAYAQAVIDLKNGRVDCIITDEVPAKNFAAKSNGELVTCEKECFKTLTAIGVKKGNEKLLKVINEVLKEMKENGELEASFKKHAQ